MSSESLLDIIHKNRHGFYELKKKPNANNLAKYYAEEYYQQSYSVYQKIYSESELKFIQNGIQRKYFVLKTFSEKEENLKRRFLDIGSGEGWALAFFKQKGWKCIGIDYSEFGCKIHNSECLSDLIVGDIYEQVKSLVISNDQFDLIWMGNVLEHVLDPVELLSEVSKLAMEKSMLVITVPNDFSIIQQCLLEKNYISTPFWIAYPAHISYFNKESLTSICAENDWEIKDIIASYPIELNLFNEHTNYVNNKAIGKACHKARVDIDNIISEISLEKTVELYRAYATLGLGRDIIGFFRKKEKK